MKKIILLLLCAATSLSCMTAPDYDDLSSELVVSTNLDKDAEFTGYDTYYVSDTIVNLGGTDEDTIWHDDDAEQLVAQIKQNMDARGYTYVQKHQSPDIAMAVGVVKIITINYYPGWYTGYPGWFPFYGGYYPYYPWTTVYTYTTGTMVIDAYDTKNVAEKNHFRALWNSISFGALGSSESGNINRAKNAIDQSFIQSPYFQAN